MSVSLDPVSVSTSSRSWSFGDFTTFQNKIKINNKIYIFTFLNNWNKHEQELFNMTGIPNVYYLGNCFFSIPPKPTLGNKQKAPQVYPPPPNYSYINYLWVYDSLSSSLRNLNQIWLIRIVNLCFHLNHFFDIIFSFLYLKVL